MAEEPDTGIQYRLGHYRSHRGARPTEPALVSPPILQRTLFGVDGSVGRIKPGLRSCGFRAPRVGAETGRTRDSRGSRGPIESSRRVPAALWTVAEHPRGR